jgi:hypothetical protein
LYGTLEATTYQYYATRTEPSNLRDVPETHTITVFSDKHACSILIIVMSLSKLNACLSHQDFNSTSPKKVKIRPPPHDQPWLHQSSYPTPMVKHSKISMTKATTTPVSYLIKYKPLILTQLFPKIQLLQSESEWQMKGQSSVSASAADADAVKAATTARTK